MSKASLLWPSLLWPSLFLITALMAHIVFSLSVRDARAIWLNVPAAPPPEILSMAALGDEAFAYRSAAFMLQNIGNTGGRSVKFENYDYEALAGWLHNTRAYDPRSNVTPLLAAYYFSNTNDRAQLAYLVDYLEKAGGGDEGEKWRWLAQAAYIARFKMDDQPRALELAKKLAAITREDLPGWARQMPAIILSDMGDKEAAIGILLETLATHESNLAPEEANYMRFYMCETLITPEEANYQDLCANF